MIKRNKFFHLCKFFLNKIFDRCNYELVECNYMRHVHSIVENFNIINHKLEILNALKNINEEEYNLLKGIDYKSQYSQDYFVLSHSEFKRSGYFVEFGACDGIELSNTYVLEKKFGWNGILAEPGRGWHSNLFANRSCHIDTGCVWRLSEEFLMFNEIGGHSTIDQFTESDYLSKSRNVGSKYEVKTISLRDLLKKYEAPYNIDFLSIDTEGSEFEILSSFDFDEYDIRIITCEHNFTPQREKLITLLTSKGYYHVLDGLTYVDDWFVKSDD